MKPASSRSRMKARRIRSCRPKSKRTSVGGRYHWARVGWYSGTEQPTAEVVAVRFLCLRRFLIGLLGPLSRDPAWQDLHRRHSGLQPARCGGGGHRNRPRGSAYRAKIEKASFEQIEADPDLLIATAAGRPSPKTAPPAMARRCRRQGLPDPGRRRLAVGRQGVRHPHDAAARRPLAGRWRHPDLGNAEVRRGQAVDHRADR